MAGTRAGTKEKQSNAISIIDAINAINLVNNSINLFMAPSKNISFVAKNPLKFILELLNHIGITEEELKKWLIDFLVKTLPIIELGVKAILLAQLKRRVSCSSDPRIPAKFRKKHSLNDDNNTNTNGIYISVDAIDMFDKLSVSPLSDDGRELYFGTSGIVSAYQFARAYDFDAFLWFVMHKAKFVNPTEIEYDSDNEKYKYKDLNTFFSVNYYSSSVSGTSLLGDVKINFPPINLTEDKENRTSKILPGNTFIYKNENNSGNIISMCINAKSKTVINSDNIEPIDLNIGEITIPKLSIYNYIAENELVPVSDDWKSANWYGYLNITKSFKSYSKDDGIIERDYSKEKAICNVQYFENAVDKQNASDVIGRKFLVSILPKPFVHIPHNNEPFWRYIRLLFDADGKPSKNGKYSISKDGFQKVEEDKEEEKDYVEYDCVDDEGLSIRVDKKTGDYYVVDEDGKKATGEALQKFANLWLMECYPGLTVYEFNYDYIMSLRLFDPKVVASSLIKSALNLDLGINAKITTQKAERQEIIRQVIKKIIESDESETSDCFYNFSNEKYEELNRIAEERRLHINKVGDSTIQPNYENIQNILDEYDDNATLEKKSDVLTRAITSASLEANRSVQNSSDKTKVKISFISNILQSLIDAIVEAFLSPKLLMLLMINQKLMSSENDNMLKMTWKDVLNSMYDVILSIVKEIVDMVCTELLNKLLKELEPLKNLMIDLVANEKAKRYRELIQTIIKNCNLLSFNFTNPFGNQFDNTVITNVDYADIDRNEMAIDKPKTNNC